MTERLTFYVMVDRPAVKCAGSKVLRQTNKPRHEHRTLESATTEALRLATKTRQRTVVLQVVATVAAVLKEPTHAPA